MHTEQISDFFVSYTQADHQWAEWIAWVLEDAGYSTIIQAWDFRAGGNFVIEMDKAAKRAARTIAVLSPDYFGSSFVQAEWSAAFKRDPAGDQGTLLPIRVRECVVEGLLGQLVYIDLVGRDGITAKEELLRRTSRERAKPLLEPVFPGVNVEEPCYPGTSRRMVEIGTELKEFQPTKRDNNLNLGPDAVPRADSSTEELIRILSLRTRKIVSELRSRHQYASVESYIVRFLDLHKAHVEALRKGYVAEAHEIVGQIYNLSYELESDEFWTRHRQETPFRSYMLALNAFKNGPLLEWYLGKQLKDDFYNRCRREQFYAEELVRSRFTIRKRNASVEITIPKDGSIVQHTLRVSGHVLERMTYKHMLIGVLNTCTGRIGVDHVHDLNNDIWSFQRLIGESADTGIKFVLFVFLSDIDIPVFPDSDISSLLHERPNAQITIYRA